MPNTILERIERDREALSILEAFAERNEIALESVMFSFNFAMKPPGLTIYATYESPRVRDAILCEIGDKLGRNGWQRRHNSSSRDLYDFVRTVDGVTVTIEGAQQLSMEDDTAVPPTAFPLFLNQAV